MGLSYHIILPSRRRRVAIPSNATQRNLDCGSVGGISVCECLTFGWDTLADLVWIVLLLLALVLLLEHRRDGRSSFRCTVIP